MNITVDEKNVRDVVDGFKEFLKRVEEQASLNIAEMKKFMEPIFSQAGYRSSETVENVLILHEAGAGDFITMSAGIREIRRAFPTAHITMVVSQNAGSLAEHCPHIDELLVEPFMFRGANISRYIIAPKNYAGMCLVLLDIAEKLLTRRYDIAFASMYSAPTTPLLAYMAGARRRVGHKFGSWSAFLTDIVSQQDYGSHAADKMLSYIEHVTGKRATDRRLEAWFSSDDLEKVNALIPPHQKLYALGLGGGLAKNHYPPESYAKFINLMLDADDDVKFVLLGGPDDVKDGQSVMSRVDGGRVVDLTGKITFRQTAAAISLCDLYIGNDTGSTHLAAATQTPLITLHCFPLDLCRPNPNLNRWFPYEVPSVVVCPSRALPECRDSKDIRGCRGGRAHCIRQITPRDLFAAYKVLLDRIDKGDNKYVLFDPEGDTAVIEDDGAARVVDGFKEYIRHVEETREFKCDELMEWLEPIFAEEGYRRTPDGKNPSATNILILHESAAGDFIAMSAAIREIRRAYPNAHIALIVDKRAANLAELCPYVDEIFVKSFVLEGGGALQLTVDNIDNIIKKLKFHLEVAKKCLMRRYDICFAPTYGSRPSLPLLAYMTGSARRISHNRGLWSPLLTDIVDQKGVGTHAADKSLSYVEYLTGESIKTRRLETWFDQNDIDAAKALMPSTKKIYALGVGGLSRKNHYPPKSYAALIKLIAASDEDVSFILLGDETDSAEAKIVLENVETDRALDLTGKTTFRQTAAAIGLCEMYIGNDTATVHLAAATNTPVLTVHCFPLDLGRPSPNLQFWHPYGVPSVVVCPAHALSGCEGSKDTRGCRAREPHCITQITPQNLFDAYKVLLDRIATGDNQYVLFAPEKNSGSDLSVVEGFDRYIRRVEESQKFNAVEMKNFMEPIFSKAGYRDPKSTVEDILILHESAAGDFISMTPMLREVRRVYPKAHITLVACTRADTLAEVCPYADKIIIDDFKLEHGGYLQLTVDDMPNIIRKLRYYAAFATKFLTRRYDICFAPTYGGRPSISLLAYMSGSARRISYDRGLWSPLLTDIVDLKGVGTHAADKVMSCIEYLTNEPVIERQMEVWFDQTDIDEVKMLMPKSEKIYAICVGGTTAKNHYPSESYAALMNLIAASDDDVSFVILGGASDNAEAAIIMKNVEPKRVVDLTGKVSFRRTAAVLSMCDIHIGNDTSTAHIAAATQTPVLVLHCFPLDLGRSSPNIRLWHPYGVPSVVVCPAHALPECVGSKDIRGCRARGPHCITQITPQNLFNAYKVLLEQIAKGNEHYMLFNPEKGVV